MDEKSDLIVIGGGIVGLATALRAQQAHPRWRILVLEKEGRVGTHQTGHNSGVIHSGIYYKSGSLKAQTCVKGAELMNEFCRDHGLPCRTVGKVVVATAQEQRPGLEELFRRGAANGVPGLRMLTTDELHALEPEVAGVAALLVPGTAITDYRLVAAKMLELIQGAGNSVRTRAEVTAVRRSSQEIVVESAAGDFSAPLVINCAGLHSDRICRKSGAEPGVRIVPFRGDYYVLAREKQGLIHRLIYPVPDPKFPFLGVHLTPTVQGSVEAGPNAVLAFKREGYRKTSLSLHDLLETLAYPGFWRMVGRYWRSGLGEMARSFSKEKFVRELQKLVPALRSEDLEEGGTGVRAQAVAADGSLVDDFRIVRDGNIVHVLNVPSPAATASLAIAETILEKAVQ